MIFSLYELVWLVFAGILPGLLNKILYH